MEGKTRAAVLAACLLVLLLSGQPGPVSAMSRYCKCFRKCYTFCRNHDQQPPPVCKVRCGSKCIIFHREVPAASALAGGDGSCREICLASVGCSTDATATGGDGGRTDADMATCVDGCIGYYGRLNAKHDGEADACCDDQELL